MLTKKECADLINSQVSNPNLKGFAESKAEYSKKCGMYDEKEINCIRINSRLQSVIALQGAKSLSPFETKMTDYTQQIASAKKEFDDNNCTKIIEQYRQSELGTVIDKFSGLDKTRIEAESIYERNQRIFFGGLILVSGIVILTIFGKNK